ncbi:MAG: permease [Desulfatiglandaceae bacterium]|jgi:uncharacterized membrane protein YraQ (UPF0718 family)
MIPAFAVLAVFALALLIVAARRGDGSARKAIRLGTDMMVKVIPLLLLAFILAGMLHSALPPRLIREWLGQHAGLRGVLIGGVCGALIPGGPYIAFPIISAVYKAGAGISTVIAFVTGWAMMGVGKIPFELAFMGTRFTLLRILLFLVFPFLAGWAAYLIF